MFKKENSSKITGFEKFIKPYLDNEVLDNLFLIILNISRATIAAKQNKNANIYHAKSGPARPTIPPRFERPKVTSQS